MTLQETKKSIEKKKNQGEGNISDNLEDFRNLSSVDDVVSLPCSASSLNQLLKNLENFSSAIDKG
jgi:hypothetical protein